MFRNAVHTSPAQVSNTPVRIEVQSVEVLPEWHPAHWEAMQDLISSHVAQVIDNRQAVEDQRALRRNRNRMYTLTLALVLLFTLPVILVHLLGALTGNFVATHYGAAIAIALDYGLAAYAYIRKF